MNHPHVPAAFINALREEGPLNLACDYLQELWNELCYIKRINELDKLVMIRNRKEVPAL